MKNVIAFVCLALTVQSCATYPVPQATGGSRSDGVVEFSYTYGSFENPQPDWVTADNQAQTRCSTWGYTGADRFGGGTQQCSNFYNGSCNSWTVTVNYQCSGQPDVVR